jgi:hypothetical protein
MRPPLWRPPVEPSPAEQGVIRLVRRAKLFVWLRAHRHELFDDDFQAELAAAYQESPKGQPPVPPAQLALATILQAYTGASDDEVVEATMMDRRWQVVLDCLDAERAPFSKGTLVGFRARLVEHGLDRRLVERTIELARTSGGFGDRALRAALDASPLWGAGRVEDMINLLGHALRKALGVIARQQGRGLSWNQGVAAVAAEAGVGLLGGASVKAALDRDWDDPVARDQALGVVLGALEQVEGFVADHQLASPGVHVALGAARQVVGQDVQRPDGQPPTLRRGVARDRRISIEDPQMRHGRKSRSHLIDGYKRHVPQHPVQYPAGLVQAVLGHQVARRLGDGQREQAVEQRRYHHRQEHPAPSRQPEQPARLRPSRGRGDREVDQQRDEDAEHDRQLLQRSQPAADPGRGDLRDVGRRDH